MALPSNIQKEIEQKAEEARIHPEKGQQGAYSNLMLYEVNDEREDAYIAGATEYATKAQEYKALLDESQALLSKERDKGWKLVEALKMGKTFIDWVHANMVVTEDHQTVDFANLYMNTMHITDEALSEYNQGVEK